MKTKGEALEGRIHMLSFTAARKMKATAYIANVVIYVIVYFRWKVDYGRVTFSAFCDFNSRRMLTHGAM